MLTKRMFVMGVTASFLFVLPAAMAAESRPVRDSLIPSFTPTGEPYDHEETAAALYSGYIDYELSTSPLFGGIVYDGETMALTLYWLGQGAEVEPALAAARTGLLEDYSIDASRVELVVQPGIYGLQELAEVGPRVDFEGKGILGIGPTPGGTGLTAYVLEGHELAGMDPWSAGEYLGVAYPIDRVKILETGFRAMSRQNDTGTFDGGSFLDNNQGCTSGFPARLNGTRGMLTAAHCTGGLNTVIRHNGSSRGTVQWRHTGRDIAYFGGFSTGYSSWLYHGTHTTSDRRAHGGRTPTRPAVGLNMCLSGAASGSFCGITIESYDNTIPTTFGTMTNAILTERTAAGGVGGKGDSGAPNMRWVWSPSYGRWQAHAIGLASANAAPTPCIGVAIECGTKGAHADLVRMEQAYSQLRLLEPPP